MATPKVTKGPKPASNSDIDRLKPRGAKPKKLKAMRMPDRSKAFRSRKP